MTFLRRLGQVGSRVLKGAPGVLRGIGQVATKLDSSPLGSVLRANPFTSAALSAAKQGGKAADLIERVGGQTKENLGEVKRITNEVKGSLERGGKNMREPNTRPVMRPAVMDAPQVQNVRNDAINRTTVKPKIMLNPDGSPIY